MRLKKLFVGIMIAAITFTNVAYPQLVQAKKSYDWIEVKRKKINKNPHIPEWKKKIINQKLNTKKAIIKAKKSRYK